MAVLQATLSVDINVLDFNVYVRNFGSDEFFDDYGSVGSTFDIYNIITDNAFGVALGGNGFAYDQNGYMVNGTVMAFAEMYYYSGTWYDIYSVYDVSVSMSAFRDAALTATEADDLAVMRTAFSGNDTMTLSDFNDSWRGFAGNDRIDGKDGGDKIKGDDGNDRLNGGKGDDKVYGGSGHDQINGGSGADKLFGNKGRDTIKTGTGDDVATGGDGEDVFVFVTGDGADEVKDFDAIGSKHDVIDLSGMDTIKGWKDLSNNHIAQVGADVVIDAEGGDTITLTGVNLADLDKADFVF